MVGLRRMLSSEACWPSGSGAGWVVEVGLVVAVAGAAPVSEEGLEEYAGNDGWGAGGGATWLG